MGKSPSVQLALFEEAIKLLPEKQSPITEEVLNQAHYAKATLKELFRLRPISVGVGRVLDKSAVFSDYEVPQDVSKLPKRTQFGQTTLKCTRNHRHCASAKFYRRSATTN